MSIGPEYKKDIKTVGQMDFGGLKRWYLVIGFRNHIGFGLIENS